MQPASVLIIACGALAREIGAVIAADGLDHVRLTCLPATLHNRPELIPEAVREAVLEARGRYDRIYCAYADCGTGGALDEVLAELGVQRIAGPHCYAFYAGQERFAALADAEPGTFYLTDFLARQFEAMVVRPLGLDTHPELRDAYFGNYRRLVYLAQTEDPALMAAAEAAARRLGLAFEVARTGMGELASFIREVAEGGGADHSLLAGHPGAGDREGRAQDGQAPASRTVRAGHRPRRHAGRPHRNRRLSRAVAED